MSGAMTAIAVGSAASGAIGAYSSAESTASSLEFQSKISEINAGVATNTADLVELVGESNAEAILTTGEFNAAIAELGAQSALSAGEKEIASYTMQVGQVKGKQRASMAANGVDLGVGSAAEVQASTEIVKEIDKKTIAANAARSAWGYRAQGGSDLLSSKLAAMNTSMSYKMEAMNLRTGATNSLISSTLNSGMASAYSGTSAALTSLLGSAGSVASTYYQYSKSGDK